MNPIHTKLIDHKGSLIPGQPGMKPRELMVLTGFVALVVWLVSWAVAGL
jgi:hypothetical protein